jgi:hypothetical protein
MSDEHIFFDGTLLQACSSRKSAGSQDNDEPLTSGSNPEVDFTSGLLRKALQQRTPAVLGSLARALIEKRNELVVGIYATQATGTAERETALALVDALRDRRRIVLGVDKGYGAAEFVVDLRARDVTSRIPQDTNGRSSIDGRTKRHVEYEVSQRKRKRVEEIVGFPGRPQSVQALLSRAARSKRIASLHPHCVQFTPYPHLRAARTRHQCVLCLEIDDYS